MIEELARKIVQAEKRMGDRIQGFHYGDKHVIRDVYRPWGEQVLWKAPVIDHTMEEFLEQCAVERMKLALREAGLSDEPKETGQRSIP